MHSPVAEFAKNSASCDCLTKSINVGHHAFPASEFWRIPLHPATGLDMKPSICESFGPLLRHSALSVISHDGFAMLKLRRRSVRLANSIGAAALALALFATGCTQSQRQTIMGEGFNDEFAKSGDKLRNSGNGGEYDGLSTKSRQIENDLGVR
jgi:hypothetical protein